MVVVMTASARGASSRRWEGVVLFVIALWVALMLGQYRKALSASESVHFAVNFPAMTTARAGGLGAMGKDGPVVIDLARTGFIKNLIQPHRINISSHWISNKGDRPRRIRLELVGIDYPTEWQTTDKTFNPRTHEFGRLIAPKQSVSVDWDIEIPAAAAKRKAIASGGVAVIDAQTGERISLLPIRIVNKGGVGAASDCCAP